LFFLFQNVLRGNWMIAGDLTAFDAWTDEQVMAEAGRAPTKSFNGSPRPPLPKRAGQKPLVRLLLGKQLAQLGIGIGIGQTEVEHDLLHDALERSRGNRSAAARALGLSRAQFNYRIDQRAN
jgi:transcriptional regulator with AAA-type ATPase domain